jgi:maleylpyruvate isomerase
VKLYTYWRSSCSWRVRIALEFKGIAYETVPVNLVRNGGEHWNSEFRDKNPMAQVPLLEVSESDGPSSESRRRRAEPDADEVPDSGPTERIIRIAQSLAILEYLEEIYPEPPLLPADAAERALCRQIAETVNSGIQPLQNVRVQGYLEEQGLNPNPLVQRFVRAGLEAIERVTQSSAGRYLVGDAVSFADVCVVPQLYGARRVGVDVAVYPTLWRCEQACAELAAFQRARPEVQPDATA